MAAPLIAEFVSHGKPSWARDQMKLERLNALLIYETVMSK